jgi:hypothetical protein
MKSLFALAVGFCVVFGFIQYCRDGISVVSDSEAASLTGGACERLYRIKKCDVGAECPTDENTGFKKTNRDRSSLV